MMFHERYCKREIYFMRERGTCLSEYEACLKQAGTDFNEQTFLKPNGKF